MSGNKGIFHHLEALFHNLRSRQGHSVSVRSVPLSGRVSVTAHSGCMGLGDNSLEAMAAGIEAGATIVEFDLHFTDDGTPVLSHDKPSEKSACVTLAEAFAFLARQNGVQANVDVKSTEHLERVPALAAEAGVTDRIFFTGVGERDVAAVRQKCPCISCYLNASVRKSEDLNALVKKTAALGTVGLNLNWKDASPELVRAFHERGMSVSVWTVDNPTHIDSMLSFGVDNITTRRPDIVCGLIANAEKQV